MKRIGILTYHAVCNFGANIQALSTVGYFRKRGYEPVVIHWMPDEMRQQYETTVNSEQREVHRQFVERWLPITGLCRTEQDIAREIRSNDMDGLVIGSDAVLQHKTWLSRWHFPSRRIVTISAKPPSHLTFPNPFWGSFIPQLQERIPIVMMSVSSQNEWFTAIRGGVRRNMEASLARMAYISVRDTWTRQMIAYISKGKICPNVTPDPVFGFNLNVPEAIPTKQQIVQRFGLPARYIIVSLAKKGVISSEWVTAFANVCTRNGYLCVVMPTPGGYRVGRVAGAKELELPLSPLEWYGLIKYSRGYVGHNMHPIVVAIHNEVPFYSIDYYGLRTFKVWVSPQSSKIYDLLASLGYLEQRFRDGGIRRQTPFPEDVHERLLSRGQEANRARIAAEAKAIQYDDMMKEITSVIENRAGGET